MQDIVYKWIIYLPCLLVVNGFGMVLNISVIVMFFRFHRKLLSTNNNKFLFSLAVADSLVGIFGITGSTLHYLHHKGLVASDYLRLCGNIPIFGSLFMSVLSLCTLTTDRLIAVVYALRYHSIMTEFRAKLLIGFTWLTVIISTVILGSVYLGISPSIEFTMRFYQLVGFFILGTIALSVGNVKMYFIVRNKQQKALVIETQNNEFPVSTKSPDKIKRKRTIQLPKNMRKIFSNRKICFWMLTAFLICWLPVTVNYISFSLGYPDPDDLRFAICICIASSNSLINPIIYLVVRKDFRKRFRELFYHCKRTDRNDTITRKYR